ncbi:hypothetical protein AMTR_s03018p00001500, partial [Amborella trichopoda]
MWDGGGSRTEPQSMDRRRPWPSLFRSPSATGKQRLTAPTRTEIPSDQKGGRSSISAHYAKSARMGAGTSARAGAGTAWGLPHVSPGSILESITPGPKIDMARNSISQ